MKVALGDRVRVIVCPPIYKLCVPLIGKLGRVVYIYRDGLIRVRLDGKGDLALYEDEIESISTKEE